MSTIVDRPPTEEQHAAIEAPGLVFVSAGAGTGKTTVLVERFVRAVEAGVDVASILVITYTDRAAAELRTRIRARLAQLGRPELIRDLDGAWISTIHGFCLRLLKQYPFAAGLDPRFRVLDESQSAVLRVEAFDEALTEFCAGGEPERLALLSTYGSLALRRMLTGVYETLRAAGRPLELSLGDTPGLDERVAELRVAAAACGADEAARLVEFLDRGPSPDSLLELSGLNMSFGGLRVISDLDLHVDEGEIVSVIGPNGRSTGSPLATATCCRGCSRASSGRIRGPRTASRAWITTTSSSAPATCSRATRRFANASSCASGRSASTSSRTRTGSSAS